MAEDSKLTETLRGVYNSLTDEQKAKAKACRNAEELMQLAAAEGIELPDEVLQAVSGGYILYPASPHGSNYRFDPNNDVWEVINDVDDSVMEGGIIGRAAAEQRAAALGQSTAEVQLSVVLGNRRSAAMRAAAAPAPSSKGC